MRREANEITNAQAAVDALKLAASYGANDAGTPMTVGSAQALATLAVADQLKRIADQGEPRVMEDKSVSTSEYGVSDALRERIALTKDALNALGKGYRADWSDFDGRTLRDQLDNIICEILLGDDDAVAVGQRDSFEAWAARRAS